jgi:hypothetical protein
MDNVNQYISNTIGWLRLPVLASSGLAVVLSSLLYFKQKCAASVDIPYRVSF